jgi:hypothetical protein
MTLPRAERESVCGVKTQLALDTTLWLGLALSIHPGKPNGE